MLKRTLEISKMMFKLSSCFYENKMSPKYEDMSQDNLFSQLKERFGHLIVDVPDNDVFDSILSVLYDDEDIPIVININTKPTLVDERFAEKTGYTDLEDLNERIDIIAERGLIVDLNMKEGRYLMVPEYIPGFYEFSLLTMAGEKDTEEVIERLKSRNITWKEMMELYEEYHGMYGDAHLDGDTMFLRSAPYGGGENEDIYTSEFLDYETAKGVIENSEFVTLFDCVCKVLQHERGTVPIPDGHPIRCCFSMNEKALFMHKSGYGELVSQEEALEMLKTVADLGYCHSMENSKRGSMMCNCDVRWCHILRHMVDRKSHTLMKSRCSPIFNFEERCIGCGKCIEVCPTKNIELYEVKETENNNNQKVLKKARRIDEDFCIGCMACEHGCPSQAIGIERRFSEEEDYIPEDFIELQIRMAFERNSLKSFMFANPQNITQKHIRKIVHYIFEKYNQCDAEENKIKKILEPFESKFLDMVCFVARKQFSPTVQKLEDDINFDKKNTKFLKEKRFKY